MKCFTKFLLVPALVGSLTLSLLLGGCSGRSSNYSVSKMGSASSTAASAQRMDAAMDAPAAAPRPMSPQLEGSPDTGGGVMANPSTGSDGMMKNSAMVSDDMPSPEPENAAPEGEPRKLVKNGNLSLETTDFDPAVAQIIKLIDELGGYVDNQSVDGKSLRDSGEYYERNATITARIPAEKLATATTKLGEICNIIAQSESVSDITDQYYDATARLEVLTVKEARLTELLAKAEKLEDIIQLESALSDCQYEADRLTGQLRRMDNQVSYSTLTLTLYEVVEYKTMTGEPKNFGERLVDSFQRSGKRLGYATENILFTIIESGPVFLINLAVWGGLLYLVYRIFFRKRILKKRKLAAPAAPVSTDNPPENPTATE